MFHFFDGVLVDVCQILHIIPSWVICWHSDDFSVAFTAVYHIHQCNRSSFNQHARKKREAGQKDYVECIAVFPECLWYKAIVKRTSLGTIIDSIKGDNA